MQTPTAETLKQTESLFAKNREPFFNSIGHKEPYAAMDAPGILIPWISRMACSRAAQKRRCTGITRSLNWQS
jgi:hypothetical protein